MHATGQEKAFNGSRARRWSGAHSAAAGTALRGAQILLSLVQNVLRDQAAIWSFPRLLWQGKYRRVTAVVLLITALLFAIDPRDPPYFRHARHLSAFNAIVSGQHAAALMWIVMIAALFVGWARGDRYLSQTFFLALQAILSSELLTQVMKGIDRRVRPQDAENYRRFVDTWFQDKGVWYGGHGSFPSGHMIAAISIATVFAMRYRHHRWAPWTAYGAAGIIGFSRITLLSHFPSDVFVAAVLGYAIARQAVLRDQGHTPAGELSGAESREDTQVGALG